MTQEHSAVKVGCYFLFDHFPV